MIAQGIIFAALGFLDIIISTCCAINQGLLCGCLDEASSHNYRFTVASL